MALLLLAELYLPHLGYLPAVLADEDDGVAEAQRRDRELAVNKDEGQSWSDLKKGLNR